MSGVLWPDEEELQTFQKAFNEALNPPKPQLQLDEVLARMAELLPQVSDSLPHRPSVAWSLQRM